MLYWGEKDLNKWKGYSITSFSILLCFQVEMECISYKKHWNLLYLVFPLGLARAFLRALFAEVFAVPVERVFPLHFYLCRFLVGPPWDSGQQAEIYGKQEGKGYGLIWFKVKKPLWFSAHYTLTYSLDFLQDLRAVSTNLSWLIKLAAEAVSQGSGPRGHWEETTALSLPQAKKRTRVSWYSLCTWVSGMRTGCCRFLRSLMMKSLCQQIHEISEKSWLLPWACAGLQCWRE